METALSTLAQVFVGPLVGTISDHYGPAILEKIGIKWDVNEEMEKLSVILLTIQQVLEDAEDKQTTSKLIRLWLRKLKDIAYDVEDLLEECATEALHDPESTGIIDKATMIERIKQVINKFEEIAKQKSEFNLISHTSTTSGVHCSRVDPRRETSSFPTEFKVIGRDEEKERIVNRLVNNINAENLSIYAIVGIGGLGKTTLAQMVYNDNMVESHFEIKRWVCVSENFDVKSLIGDIIQSESNNNSQTLDQLQRRLQTIISGKRFLLILDDVWNEDQTKWERLKSTLRCGAKGSSIIVTTRSNKVASLMRSSHVCHPEMLSEEDCFSLLKHHAFDEGEGKHYPNLESIGKEIVKKCGGVPLAAKALGGLLRFQREEKEWLFVKESKLWDLPQDEEDSILPALRLSYKHLSQHLRQCFAYCSIFPKDYRMKKEVLIQLWMANGFLQPKGNMELEDIGNGVFNDLLWRGFFQEDQEVDIFNIFNISYKMHDLVHDLACSITRDECFSVVTNADKELVIGRCKSTRHFAIYRKILFSPDFSLSMFQSFLRTLLLLHLPFPHRHPSSLNLSNHIYLRVLDLSGSEYLETLPESIASLKLLRYLDLSNTSIALLSDEVFGNLINLQTLKLRSCSNLEMLPGNMRKLTNLRHLDISNSTSELLGMPVGMGQLKCLHNLSHFIVSEESGCGVGELQELDHLGGTLTIECLGKLRDSKDAENAKLSRKENIRDLRLTWFRLDLLCLPFVTSELEFSREFKRLKMTTAESQTNSMMNYKLIADALQPHPNLLSLEFSYYGGSDFPRWMNYSTCLFSLVTLRLHNCSKCKHLPTLGLLPHLKKLYLRSMGVECIGNEFYCDEEDNNRMMKTRGGGEGMVLLFPALEELELHDMCSLEEWKGWSSSSALPSSSSRMKEGETQVSVFPVLKKVFPVLKTLKIGDCPNLRTLPSLKCSEKIFEGMVLLQNLNALQELEIDKCPMLVNLPWGTGSLTSLKFLTIEDCDGLKSLNLQLLTNLHKLEIRNCRELELLSDDFQNFVSLQFLTLEALPKLADLPVLGSNQRSLKDLNLRFCENLESLPDALQHLTSLQRLEIRNCHPELNRRSLQRRLEIRNCHPELHRRSSYLTYLQRLEIRNCHPELHRRCKKNTGEDWHKIAHIPILIIKDESDNAR